LCACLPAGRLATKKYDLKTIEVMASGTKQKTEAFYFFCKKLVFVLCGILRDDWFFTCELLS